jgi:hypothetical protein
MRQRIWVTRILLLVIGIALAAPGVQSGAAADGWYAEFYDNASLSGGPVLTRREPTLHFEWYTGSPGANVPADGFSARFTQEIWFGGGTYRFTFRSDDGLRLWIDDTLVLDRWYDQGAEWHTHDHYIAAGVHRVRVAYYEHTGTAMLQVGWEPLHAGATWRANYYANPSLSGDPVLTRNDAAVDFDWGDGSPGPAVPADQFSARWARTLGFEAGTYRFYASCDDGVRVTVDGHRVVDAWHNQKLPNTRWGDLALSAGQHTVEVTYFEDGGVASAHVWWDRLDTLGGWEGRYYDNRQFRGGPAMIRDDAEINFDWGAGAPTDWIPSDDFSIIWTRTLDFTPGLYRFNFRTDDGVRLWIDGTELLMNYWEPHDNAWHYRDWHYLEGRHTLKVEYFEEAGNARVQFWWNYAADVEAARAMPPSPVYGFDRAPRPGATPSPATPPAPLPGPWEGAYFTGRDLSQTPALVRDDAVIDFDWGWGAPAPEIPVNQFAVRWTGTFTFDGGRYRFTTTTDDGVRVYVDDVLVLNRWRPMRGTRTATTDLAAGQHTVRVEYFEAMQAAKARVTWVRVGDSAASPQ